MTKADTWEATICGLDITYEYDVLDKSGEVDIGPGDTEELVPCYTENDIKIHDIYVFGEDMPESFRFFVPRSDTFDKNSKRIIDLIIENCLDHINDED